MSTEYRWIDTGCMAHPKGRDSDNVAAIQINLGETNRASRIGLLWRIPLQVAWKYLLYMDEHFHFVPIIEGGGEQFTAAEWMARIDAIPQRHGRTM